MSDDVQPGSMPTNGRWDRYKDHEGREYQRVSTLIKKVETNRFNLELWMKRQVLIGASLRDDLVLGAKAMKPHPVTGWSDAQKKDLNKLVATAEEAAKETDGAVLGTAVHTLTERLDRGEDIESVVRGLPAQAERDLRAYEALVRLNGWQTVEVERTVVNDEIDVAGTFDRVYRIGELRSLLGPGRCQHGHSDHVDRRPDDPLGELPVIGDVKTERDPTLNGLHIGPQLAIYARARRMWLPASPVPYGGLADEPARYVDTPCVRQDVAVVVHVRDGHAVPYFVNIVEGWDAALAARAQNEREKSAKRWLVPMPGIREPAPLAVVIATSVHQAAQPAPSALVMPPLPGAGPVVREEVAVQVAPGVVAWQTANVDRVVERALGTQVEVGGVGFTKIDTVTNVVSHGALDDVDKQAIETIWSAGDLDGLTAVWKIYTGVVGREWKGRVAEAGAARRAQIECVQRAGHGAPGALKCACGWTKGILA